MRLGVAGCGRITERGYIPAALSTPGVEIVAFTDPDQERLERCLREWGQAGKAEGFDGIAPLLERTSIDLLVVAAPAATHVPLAEAAAAAGVRSLVEKPPAADLDGAQRLAALDPEPLVAFNRRFLQGVELREAVPSEGWLELDLELRFQRAGWGAHEARDEALLDAGVHLIDLACHLSGATPVAVRRAETSTERAEFELELSRGRARLSCATDRRYRELVEIRDRAGRLLGRSVLGQVRGKVAALRGAPDPLVLSLGRQLAALHDGEQLATAHDGAVVMSVIDAVRQSADLGGAEVTVAPVGAAA
jgi:predicted dehydrogenase